MLALGNAVSSSRTGLVQLVLLCGLWLMWGGWQRVWLRNLLLAVLLIYTTAMFAAPFAAGLDMTSHAALLRMGNDAPCSSRLVLWSNVLHLIGQKPWLGWGWGNLDYAHFITLYNEPRFCDILDNAHNLPLHLAVELGVPAAVGGCGAFAVWVTKQKPWLERDPGRQLAWSVLAVILLHSLLEYPLWYGPFMVAFVLCVLVLRPTPDVPKEAEKSVKKQLNWPLARILRAQTAIILIAFTGYAAWDYHRVSQIYIQPEARDAAYRDNTLEKASQSWLFADQARFAALLTTPLTRANAQQTFASASQLLHYSPEPRVVEKLIESAVMLNRDAEALAYLARYRAAFAKEHAAWAKANATPLQN